MTESSPESGFFHCGRCGAVFPAPTGALVSRRCPECGNDPVPPSIRREPLELPVDPAAAADAASQDAPSGEADAAKRRHGKRHRKKTSTFQNVAVLIGIWLTLLGVFAVSMKLYRSHEEQKENERSAHLRESRRSLEVAGLDPNLQERERVFLTRAFPKCQNAFLAFLSSTTPELRAQWVAGGPDMVGKMSRFQGVTSLFRPSEPPKNDYAGVIETADGPLVETMWKCEEGYRIEAVFLLEKDEWRLDWEAFARFSEMPWAIFAAGAGPEVQEFRLLARERLAKERMMDPALSVVLHPPRFGVPREAGAPSPEFVVPRQSVPGRKLEALFRMKKEGKTCLGAKLPAEDPDGMIRVRVKIRRLLDARGVRKFEIEDVVAGHWLSIKDSGIPVVDEDTKAPDPAPPPGHKEGTNP